MNRNFNRTNEPKEKSLWLPTTKRTRRQHLPENKYREVRPKLLRPMIHLMMNLRKILMKMSSPSFHEKSKKCDETKEDLDDISTDEEANICLMADRTFDESESDQEDEVNFDDLDLCLEIETSAREKANLCKNFQELENKLKDLQNDLKELNELHDYQKEERYDLQRECAQAHKDYEDLKMSKHNLWVECKELKRFVKFLNDKLLKNQEVKGQPQDVVKLHEEIRTLKTTLAKFVNGTNNLNKLLGYCRCSLDKFGNGYDGKVYVHDKDTIVCYFYGKTGHMTFKCKDRLKKEQSQKKAPQVDLDAINKRKQKRLAKAIADKDQGLKNFGISKKI
ncbi:hypothetical protein HKD37_17G048601 [Glycine soja]